MKYLHIHVLIHLLSQEVRYFSEGYSTVDGLEATLSESPHDVELWIKLACMKLRQKADSEEQIEQLSERNLRQALSTLSRGLEANRNSEVSKYPWVRILNMFMIRPISDYMPSSFSKYIASVSVNDLVRIYCALIRSVLEYASPVWSSLTVYLSKHIESIQNKELRIILGANDISYQDALITSSLETLLYLRDMACVRFIKKVRTGQIEPLYSAIIGTNNTDVNHGYGLCSGGVKANRHEPSTKLFSEFVTSKYM